MRNLIFTILAVILLPVAIVVALGVFTGLLTGGITAAVNIEFVNGYSLQSLREVEPSTHYPDSIILERYGRRANSAVIGRDVTPSSGFRFLASGEYSDVERFYDEILTAQGFKAIAIPTPLIAQHDEVAVSVWRKDNLYFRLSFRTDSRLLVESGGGIGDVVFDVHLTPLHE